MAYLHDPQLPFNNMASFSFFIRTPAGRIPADDDILRQPLLVDAGERHPSLTVADYFESLKQLVQSSAVTLSLAGMPNESDALLTCRICSEKLGAFYHVARIEVVSKEKTFSFAVNTAVSERGRHCLQQDHELLTRLLPPALQPFVPKVYLLAESVAGNSGDCTTALLHMAVEWLENFHEWHFCSSASGARRFGMWSDSGVQFLAEEEARQLFRQIANIVSLSYDWENSTFLQQWHHAAGDFIVRHQEKGMEVRLITVRDLRPFSFLALQTVEERYLSALLFLLDLSIRLRLDKLDGVGQTVWLEDFVVHEAVQGFLDALAENRDRIAEAYLPLLQLLASCSADDFQKIGALLLSSYRETLPDAELEAVLNNFDAHVRHLSASMEELGRRQSTLLEDCP